MRVFQPIEPARTGAGTMSFSFGILPIVMGLSLLPNLISSPLILPYPQRFSRARRMTQALISTLIGCRPTLLFFGWVHLRLTSCRCQLKTVSGWKIRIRLRNCLTGQFVCFFTLAESPAKFSFSARLGLMGLSRWRCRMPRCCRRIRFSNSCLCRGCDWDENASRRSKKSETEWTWPWISVLQTRCNMI